MKRQVDVLLKGKFIFNVAAIFGLAWSSVQAAVTAVDFEEFALWQNLSLFPADVHGVTFSDDFGVVRPTLSYLVHSGATGAGSQRISTGYKECTFTFTTPGRRFVGAWFFVGRDSVQFVLHKGGDVVGKSSILSETPVPIFLASGYDGPVDSVGILGNRGQYILDDLTWSDDPQLVCTPHASLAIAHVTGGAVTGVSITDPGCGYTNAPLVLILGGGGYGAAATAVVAEGRITAINIESAGCCYTDVPKIVIASPPFTPSVAVTVSTVRVTQHVVLGRRYVLDSSTNLLNWVVTGSPFTAENETVESEFDVSATGRFFRLREVP